MMADSAVVIPIICFPILFLTHMYEFKRMSQLRALFSQVRKGWVEENYLKGQQAVNTTRDYIRVSLFFGNTAIIIANFAAGFAGTRYTSCQNSENGCTTHDIHLLIKTGMLVTIMLSIFFMFTQCSRFMNHFSFMINTRSVNGKLLPKALTRRVFDHAHAYYGIGLRMYFLTVPVFAWFFTEWTLLCITPFYVLVIKGLESGSFMSKELSTLEQNSTVNLSHSNRPINRIIHDEESLLLSTY